MMRATTIVVAVVALVAAPAWSGWPPDFCARVVVGSESVHPLESGTSSFSARKVEDLRLEVLFLTEISGDPVLEVELLTPRGHHYQTLTSPISTDPGEAGGRRRVARYPRPLEVQIVEQVMVPEGTVQSVTVSLPVAGTAIVSSGLYGTWTVNVSLDGVLMACEVLNTFTLSE